MRRYCQSMGYPDRKSSADVYRSRERYQCCSVRLPLLLSPIYETLSLGPKLKEARDKQD